MDRRAALRPFRVATVHIERVVGFFVGPVVGHLGKGARRGDCELSGSAVALRHASQQQANIILRHAPILPFVPFCLFIVDSHAQPLKQTLLPAALRIKMVVDIPLDQHDAIRIIRPSLAKTRNASMYVLSRSMPLPWHTG
jgi:hypothetical protein